MQEEFLFPTATQYRIDQGCSEIVQTLHKRHFAVAGVEITFETYSNVKNIYTMVDTIKIPDIDLYLRFGRDQGYIDSNRFNTAAVSDLAIPRKLLNVYSDYSGPTLYVYVGKNWEHDKDRFINGSHVNSKLYGEPRTYLKYKGSSNPKGGSSYQNQWNSYLANDNDLDREYSPTFREVTYYKTDDIMTEFESFLVQNVLTYIHKMPNRSIPNSKLEIIGSVWKGLATPQNRESIVIKLREMLTGHTYNFDNGSSRIRTEEFFGLSSYGNQNSGSISISDSYGSWYLATDNKTVVEFNQNSITIQQTISNGDLRNWKITIID